jgi:DNA mismatch endonuclease, patch repair protein
MSKQRTTGTRPELALRRELHKRGLRFRVNLRGLVGRPDVVLTRARIAVFVDGCFWHGCPIHAVQPTANAAWWSDKLATNRSRDERVTSVLESEGWMVLRIWEHDDPREAARTIEDEWRSRTGRPIH